MFIDTHCHLPLMLELANKYPKSYLPNETLATLVSDAEKQQVSRLITIGTTLADSDQAIEVAYQFPNVFAAIGVHPNECTPQWRTDVQGLKKRLAADTENRIVAIGECGIDRHYPGYNLAHQQSLFKAQIELALAHNKALVVHTRDAREETLSCLAEYKNEPLRATIHCFSEPLETAQELVKQGFVLGIGATITYPKNDYLRAVVAAIPLESLVLETDAPFLPPQRIRGQRNHPQYIPEIAQAVAHLKGVDLALVATQTTAAATKLFGLPTET